MINACNVTFPAAKGYIGGLDFFGVTVYEHCHFALDFVLYDAYLVFVVSFSLY